MNKQNKHNSLFWFGFVVALVLVAGLAIYYYKDNKNKKLKDIKKQIEDFVDQKFKCQNSQSAKSPVKAQKRVTKPKKFIVKK